MFAWIVQRLTGLGLVLFIAMHLSSLKKITLSPEAFNHLMETYRSPLFKLAEIGLLAGVIFHGFNGARITTMDLGLESKKQKRFFWMFFGAALLAFAAGVLPIVLEVLE